MSAPPRLEQLYGVKHAVGATHRGQRLQSVTVATILILATAPLTLARLAGGGTITPLPQLAALAPLGVVFALAATVAAVAARSRAVVAVAVALAALHLAWLAPTLIPNRAAPMTGPHATLRLLTLNAYEGHADADVIMNEVRREGVDVLALEELTPELQVRLMRAGLAETLPYAHSLPGAGASGIGIFSRLPMQPQARAVTGTSFPMPRTYVVLPNGDRLSVSAVHTISPRPGQVRGWERDLGVIASVVGGSRGAQVVVGDFNASRDHAGFRAILAAGRLADGADTLGSLSWPALTWPANVPGLAPFVRLDHVLVSPGVVSVTGLATVAVPGTDHRGVLVDLAVRDLRLHG